MSPVGRRHCQWEVGRGREIGKPKEGAPRGALGTHFWCKIYRGIIKTQETRETMFDAVVF